MHYLKQWVYFENKMSYIYLRSFNEKFNRRINKAYKGDPFKLQFNIVIRFFLEHYGTKVNIYKTHL